MPIPVAEIKRIDRMEHVRGKARKHMTGHKHLRAQNRLWVAALNVPCDVEECLSLLDSDPLEAQTLKG